jgi:hypothetical protein
MVKSNASRRFERVVAGFERCLETRDTTTADDCDVVFALWEDRLHLLR